MKAVTHVSILLHLLLSIISVIGHSNDRLMIVFSEIEWLVWYVVENACPHEIGPSRGVARVEPTRCTSVCGPCTGREALKEVEAPKRQVCRTEVKGRNSRGRHWW